MPIFKRALPRAALLGALAVWAAPSVTFANDLIDGARAEKSSFDLGEAFDMPEDISVAVVICGAVVQGCSDFGESVSRAAEAAGWTARVIDGRQDPAVWNQSVQQAVVDGFDVVVGGAVPPSLMQGGVQAADEAGVPIITSFIPVFDGVPPTAAHIHTDHDWAGRVAAELITEDSGGSAVTLILDPPVAPELVKRNNAMAVHFDESCAGCTTIRQEFNLGLMPQRLPGQVASAVSANPEITYIIAPVGAFSPFILQGLRSAGRDDIRILGFEGNAIGFDLIESGEMWAELATPADFHAWLAIDIAGRHLAGLPHDETIMTMQRLFVSGDDLPDNSWEPDFDYQAAFLELWQ